MRLHVALLCEELLTTDVGGMDLKERLLSSAAPLLPSPVELVVSSSGGTSQLNLGNSTRDILSRCSSSPSLFCVSSPTQGEQLTSAQACEARGCSSWSLPAQPSSRSSLACGRSCAALSPCRALSYIKSLSTIPLPWLLIWLGVMGEGEGAAPFFVSSTGDFQCVIFFCAS